MDATQLRQLYDKVDALDAPGFAAAFTPTGTLTVANGPPSRGPAAIEQGLAGLFSLLDGMRHTFLEQWPIPGGVVLEAAVSYAVRGLPVSVDIRGVTVLRGELGGSDAQLRDVRVYYDLAPVFAAAQEQHELAAPLEASEVEHLRDGARRGAFVIVRAGERAAEMTYSMAGERVAIVDHTWVSDGLRGRGAGRVLLDAVVAWARAEALQILPLCPYARSMFERDPGIRDVLGA